MFCMAVVALSATLLSSSSNETTRLSARPHDVQRGDLGKGRDRHRSTVFFDREIALLQSADRTILFVEDDDVELDKGRALYGPGTGGRGKCEQAYRRDGGTQTKR